MVPFWSCVTATTPAGSWMPDLSYFADPRSPAMPERSAIYDGFRLWISFPIDRTLRTLNRTSRTKTRLLRTFFRTLRTSYPSNSLFRLDFSAVFRPKTSLKPIKQKKRQRHVDNSAPALKTLSAASWGAKPPAGSLAMLAPAAKRGLPPGIPPLRRYAPTLNRPDATASVHQSPKSRYAAHVAGRCAPPVLPPLRSGRDVDPQVGGQALPPALRAGSPLQMAFDRKKGRSKPECDRGR